MIYYILLYLALVAGCMPVILFISKGYSIKTYGRNIFPFIILTAFSSVYEYVVSIVLAIDVILWYQVYSLLEFGALYYFFKTTIQQRPKGFFKLCLGLFSIVYTCSFFFLEFDSAFISKSITKSYLTFFVISCSFLWVKQVFDQKVILKLYHNSNFFIVMGVFFYYSTTVCLFLLSNFIFKSALPFEDFWLINIIATLILRILITIGVWKIN